MSLLHRKLRRDLFAQGAQVITVAIVVGCGVAAWVAMRGCWKSLETSRDAYYRAYGFGDAFVQVERAPEHAAAELSTITGIASVETRLVQPIRVPVASGDAPRGYAISIPDAGPPRLNAVWVREGRWPAPTCRLRCCCSGYARASGIRPGDSLRVIPMGARRTLRVAGLADSPEFTFPVAPGELFPHPQQFAVVWMRRGELAAAVGKEGAFNDLVVRASPGVTGKGLVTALDRALERYGGKGAVAAEDHLSNKMLRQEMNQLRVLALTLPIVFLVVAAFLVQVVLARMVELQRLQVATLKAFGFTTIEVARHFLSVVVVIGALGAALGLGLGHVLGRAMTQLYADFFHLPQFEFHADAELVGVLVGVSVAAAALGAGRTLWRIAAMPPAIAMQPPAPERFARLPRMPVVLGNVAGGADHFRDALRRPTRVVFSVFGIAGATAVVVLGRFGEDAMPVLERLIFEQIRRDDIEVVLERAVPRTALDPLVRLAGVRSVDVERTVNARVRHGARHRDVVVTGHPQTPRLRRIVEWPVAFVSVPEHGARVTQELAAILGLDVGSRVRAEALHGAHRVARLTVVGRVRDPIGLQMHVSGPTFAGWLKEPEAFDRVDLRVDAAERDAVRRRLAELRGILGTGSRDEGRRQFVEQTGRTRSTFVAIASAFGMALAIGVVYNNARITLATRARDLASMRILGFRTGEVAAIVLGEQLVPLVFGVPLGWWLGTRFAHAMVTEVDPETWRFPWVISTRTYAWATAVVLAAAAGCAAWTVERIRALDLVAVQKTRE